MSRLTLVRHGQAQSFNKENALTPVGEMQAARLACFWLQHGVHFDEVYSGTLARQVRTEEIVAETFRNAGRPWPQAQHDPAWNEYDASGVLGCDDPRLAGLKASADTPRGFHKLLQTAMELWLRSAGPWPASYEVFPDFRNRVTAALSRLHSGAPNRRVAVFTSGGVIGFAVHRAMQSPERSFLDVNWRIRNASLSEFLFDRDRLTLDTFNTISHLQEDSLWTYR